MPAFPRTDLFDKGIRIETDIAYIASEQLEGNVHERFRQRFAWLQEMDAPPTQTSILSIVKDAMPIGIIALTRSNDWLIVSDMELETRWRGKELGSAAIVALCRYLRQDQEWSELIEGPLIPSMYDDESSRRFLGRLMSQGLAEPLSGSVATMILLDREPIQEKPHRRIINVGSILNPIWYGSQRPLV